VGTGAIAFTVRQGGGGVVMTGLLAANDNRYLEYGGSDDHGGVEPADEPGVSGRDAGPAGANASIGF
jgi:hypothetical protein